MRKPGLEPGAQRWQRWILPLNHLRFSISASVFNCLHPKHQNASMHLIDFWSKTVREQNTINPEVVFLEGF